MSSRLPQSPHFSLSLTVECARKNSKGHGRENSDLCKKKMPYKVCRAAASRHTALTRPCQLIEFYESNLRWKATDEDDAMEE